jgi:hypothetical protein
MNAQRLTLLAAAVGAALLASCATTQEAAPKKHTLRDYYPLAVGNSWTYVIKPAPPDHAQATVELVSEENGFYKMSVGGQLAARATSITDGVRDMLREPLEVGNEWVAVPDASEVERYKIVDNNADVKTPAGMFRGCVQVEMTTEIRSRDGQKGRLIGRWSYAPGIGPIHFVQTVELGEQPPRKNIEYILVGYKIDDGADEG